MEIELGRYLFLPVEVETIKSTNHSSSPEQQEGLPYCNVLFNPLHNHESLCWIACWALFHYIPANYNLENSKVHNQCIEFAREIFHPTSISGQRVGMLFAGLPEWVPGSVLKEFELLAKAASIILLILWDHYWAAEANLPNFDEKAFDGIWRKIYMQFPMLTKHFKGLEVKMLDLKKQKFDTIKDNTVSEVDDGLSPTNKWGIID